MTNEEARQWFLKVYSEIKGKGYVDENEEAYELAIKALEQEPNENAISENGTLTVHVVDGRKVSRVLVCGDNHWGGLYYLEEDTPVRPQEQTGHCKDCKYFEYDSWLYVNETPLIAAHEVCNRWAGGWKTKADGFCFMFEKGGE